MYRALEYMNVVAPKGGTVLLAPGDAIEGFEEWSPWTQHCLVDEKRVRWAPEGITDAEKRRAQPYRPPEPKAEPAVLDEPLPTEAAAEALGEAAVADALEPAPEPQRRHDSLPQIVSERVSPEAIQLARAKTVPQVASGLSCNVCHRTGFKDATGLKIHVNKAHKGT